MTCPPRTVRGLDDEFRGEDVGQLGAVAVASSRRLLLVVIKVRAGEQMACAAAKKTAGCRVAGGVRVNAAASARLDGAVAF